LKCIDKPNNDQYSWNYEVINDKLLASFFSKISDSELKKEFESYNQ